MKSFPRVLSSCGRLLSSLIDSPKAFTGCWVSASELGLGLEKLQLIKDNVDLVRKSIAGALFLWPLSAVTETSELEKI